MFDIDILRPQLPHFDVGNLRHRDDPIDGPNIPEDDAAETEYTVQRVKHHVPCLLPKVYFQFDADEDIASFAINNRLVAANISEPREGTLHVKITLGPPAPAPDPEVFTSREGDDD